VTDATLVADLEAMRRLLPQVQALAGEVKQGLPGVISGASDASAVPSLAAAQSVSRGVLPFVQALVAARFTKVGEMIDLARRGFLLADQQLVDVVATVPTLQRSTS
jgi:hypothetical protein